VGACRNAINDAADGWIVRIAFMEILAELLNQMIPAECLFKLMLQPRSIGDDSGAAASSAIVSPPSV